MSGGFRQRLVAQALQATAAARFAEVRTKERRR